MTTTRTRYVNPGADAGGNGTTKNLTSGDNTHAYNSLSAAEAAEQGDITAATGSDEIVLFLCAGSTKDTTSATFNGWTVGSGNYVEVRSDRDQSDGFYTGTLQISTSHYNLSLIQNYLDYTIIDGIQTNNPGSFTFDLFFCSHITIRNCRLSTTSGSTSTMRWDSADDIRCYNTLIGLRNTVSLAQGSSAYTSRFYNNSIRGRIVVSGSANTCIVKNCVSFAHATAGQDWEIAANTSTGDYLASDDNDFGTNKVDLSPTDTPSEQAEWELAMVDPANATEASRDYSILNTSSVLYGAGVGSDADSEVPSTDILGNTRNTSTPSIGAFENLSVPAGAVAAAAASSRKVLLGVGF